LLKILKVGVDIGGTNVRIGFVRADDAGRALLKKSALVDLHTCKILPFQLQKPAGAHSLVRHIAGHILETCSRLTKKGWRVDRQLGVGMPGAYLADGRIHPGTVPNMPGFEKMKPWRLFSRYLGPGWRVTPSQVNNDGVVQGLLMAGCYAKSKKMTGGKIIALVPGTGFGAGIYRVKDGSVKPVGGPQQLFDVIARKARPGEPLFNGKDRNRGYPARGGEPLSMEALAAGRALQLRGSFLLKRSVTGERLSRLALNKTAGNENRYAKELFQQVGIDLARFILLIRRGRFKKMHVPCKPPTKGASVFLIGGNWLIRGAGLKISLPEARKTLLKAGCPDIKIVTINRIRELKGLAAVLGVLGASLLVKPKKPR